MNYQDEGSVLSGEGLATYEGMTVEPGREGVTVELCCPRCGTPKHLKVAWCEVVAVAQGMSPQHAYGKVHRMLVPEQTPWERIAVRDAWYPDLACEYCGGKVMAAFTVGQARDLRVRAFYQGWLLERDFSVLSTLKGLSHQLLEMTDDATSQWEAMKKEAADNTPPPVFTSPGSQ